MFKELNSEQKTMLWVLALINFFNYIDRQVIFPLFHLIKADFGVSDFELGLLGTVFMLVHSLTSLPLGILADKYSRKFIVASGVFFWSAASFASGLAVNFKMLLGVRSVVGIGEASYAPAATALIADSIPESLWSRAQSFFNSGLFLGGTLGAMLGGVIGYYFNDWRWPFFVVSVPGIVLGFLVLKIKEPQKHAHETEASAKNLFKNFSYLLLLLGGAFSTFASGAFVSWGVEFVVRFKGYNLRDASLVLGTSLMAAGVIGVLLGGYLADVIQQKYAWGRSAVVAGSQLAAFPFAMLGFATQKTGPIFIFYFFLLTLFLSFYYGPVTAIMHDIVPKNLRATAFALYILIIHLLGDTLAPAAVGAISDRSNLRLGMQFASLFVLFSAIVFFWLSFVSKRQNQSPSRIIPQEMA